MNYASKTLGTPPITIASIELSKKTKKADLQLVEVNPLVLKVDPLVLVLCLDDKVAPLSVKMASADYTVVYGPTSMVHLVLLAMEVQCLEA